MKIKLQNLSSKNVTGMILHKHSGGLFRDEADLNDAKYHTSITLNAMLEIIEDISGTLKDKKAFLKECYKEIDKFYPKEK